MIYDVVVTIALLALAAWLLMRANYSAAGLVALMAVVRFI